MPGPGHRRMQGGKRIENPGKVFKRLMRYVAASYGFHLVLVAHHFSHNLLYFLSTLFLFSPIYPADNTSCAA